MRHYQINSNTESILIRSSQLLEPQLNFSLPLPHYRSPAWYPPVVLPHETSTIKPHADNYRFRAIATGSSWRTLRRVANYAVGDYSRGRHHSISAKPFPIRKEVGRGTLVSRDFISPQNRAGYFIRMWGSAELLMLAQRESWVVMYSLYL